MVASQSKHSKKTNILILGANGFIGRAISKPLIRSNKFDVRMHSRRKDNCISDDISCSYNSDAFLRLLNTSEIIIICAGIGLAKLYKTSETNCSIMGTILNRMNVCGSRAKIIYLSSVKAYNPNGYDDIYSADKYQSELLIQANIINNNACIIRIPAVFGKNDPNLRPLCCLADYNILPLVKSSHLPKFNFIGINTLAEKISNLLEEDHINYGEVAYILNTNNTTWNEFASNFIHTKSKNSFSLKSMKTIWRFLRLLNIFSSKRCLFPWERFDDFFIREWEPQISSEIKHYYVSQDLSSAIREH